MFERSTAGTDALHKTAADTRLAERLAIYRALVAAILSGDMMKQEQFYVAASRGRDGITVITSNVDQLRDSLGISSARPSATELAREQAHIHPEQEHGLANLQTQKIEPPMPRNEVALGLDMGMGL